LDEFLKEADNALEKDSHHGFIVANEILILKCFTLIAKTYKDFTNNLLLLPQCTINLEIKGIPEECKEYNKN